MNMSIEYPQSRTGKSQCNQCKGVPGFMTDTGRIRIPDVSGNSVELLKWTCGKCGYTMLFDLTIARNVPYKDDQFEEVLPDN